jgi:membrane fusion protein, multidrug efflux system
VRLDDGDAAALVLGMTVKGIISLAEKDTLAVPRNALLHDDKGDYLFVVRAGQAHRVDVERGMEQDGLVGVSGSLAVGDAVVVTGNYELDDGMKVRTEP